jgi:hypothetical protein
MPSQPNRQRRRGGLAQSPQGRSRHRQSLRRRSSTTEPGACLLSWIQPGPEGGAFAGDGRHGSIIPKPGRVRSRNDMGRLIETED